MAESVPPRRWGCLAWIVATATALVVVLVVAVVVIQGDGDLRRIGSTATALGVPTTWGAAGVPPVPAPRLASLGRLRVLATTARIYAEWYSDRWDPFAPQSQPERDWVAAGGSGVDQDLDAEIDRLDAGPFTSWDPAAQDAAAARGDWKAVLTWSPNECRRLYTVYGARATAADPADLPALLRRIRNLDRLRDLDDPWNATRCADLWITGVLAAHHAGVTDPGWAADAEGMADAMAADSVLCARLWFVRLYRGLHAPAPVFMRQLDVRLPAIMANPLGLRLFYRLGRGAVLQPGLDLVAGLVTHGFPRRWADLPPPVVTTGAPWPTRMLDSMLEGLGSGPRQMLIRQLHTVTGLRLLAADLRGAPWPPDPCDPAGGPLRPVERGGRIIGAYGCGPDGHDDGGDRDRDWCWPLHEQLGRPRAADAPPAAPPP